MHDLHDPVPLFNVPQPLLNIGTKTHYVKKLDYVCAGYMLAML